MDARPHRNVRGNRLDKRHVIGPQHRIGIAFLDYGAKKVQHRGFPVEGHGFGQLQQRLQRNAARTLGVHAVAEL